jgi:hypothetical protein
MRGFASASGPVIRKGDKAMRQLTSSRYSLEASLRRWSRIGMAGFAFFLLKGLLWLLAPVLLAVMR